MASSQDPLGRSDPISSGAGGDLTKEDRVPYMAPSSPGTQGEMDLLCRDEVGQMEVDGDNPISLRPTEVTDRLGGLDLETIGTGGSTSAQEVLRQLVYRGGIQRPDNPTLGAYGLPPRVTRLPAEGAPRCIDPVVRQAIELYLLTDESKNFPEKWFLYWEDLRHALQVCWPLRRAVLGLEQYMREHGVSRNDTILAWIDEALRPTSTWSSSARGVPGVRPLKAANQGHDPQWGKANPADDNPKDGWKAAESDRQGNGNERVRTIEPDSILIPLRVEIPSEGRMLQPQAVREETLYCFEENPSKGTSGTASVLPTLTSEPEPETDTDSMTTAQPVPAKPVGGRAVPPGIEVPAQEPMGGSFVQVHVPPVGFYPCLRIRAMNLRFHRCFGVYPCQWDGTRKHAMALLRKKEDPGEG